MRHRKEVRCQPAAPLNARTRRGAGFRASCAPFFSPGRRAQMPQFLDFVEANLILSMIWLALFVALIATEFNRLFAGFKSITPQELTRMINRDEATVIDVGAIADYSAGHIIGARHVLPSKLDPNSKELVGLKDKPVALYCKTGMNSPAVAKKLKSAGFTQVHVLKGGLNAWIGENLPVEKKK
jgi:rhodanese-related sulfurtransferase